MFVSPLMLMLIEIGHTKEKEDRYFLTPSIGGQEVGRKDTTRLLLWSKRDSHSYLHS